MRSLPLFHRIAGQPVIVLGEGLLAEPKRRLVERAGGLVVGDVERGLEDGARLAFVALDRAEDCEAAAASLRQAGVLVNVVDRPELCDFTVPSLLERDPVLIAVGTSGASAGLAKHLRLRFERLLPSSLGDLASRLAEMRGAIRSKWPDAATRRQSLDAALGEGAVLDPFDEQSAARLDDWLRAEPSEPQAQTITLSIPSSDPEDLTLRQARLLGTADAVFHDPDIAPAILDRARADATRVPLPQPGADIPPAESGSSRLVLVLRAS